MVVKYDKVIMAGDFNFHVDDATNAPASNFINVTESFNFLQHVKGPSHNRGHTLDLVFTLGMTFSSLKLDDFISDHKCILFDAFLHPTFSTQKRTVKRHLINSL